MAKATSEHAVRKILVRAVNWVGDAVMTLPALDALGENFPTAEIIVLAKPWVAPVYADHPAVSRVMIYRKGQGALSGLGEVVSTIVKLRRERFQMAVLFQNAFEAAFLAWAAGIPRRLGYDRDGRSLLLTDRFPKSVYSPGAHQVEYYLSLLRAAGWRAESRDPTLRPPEVQRRQSLRLLAERGITEDDRIVALSPGAIYGEAKRWPAERFAALGDMAIERWGARVIIMGSGKENRVCGRTASAMTSPVVNLCGETSLDLAMAVIERCAMFVTNDSGLMHVAAALGVPTVAVFGSTDHVATGPRGSRSSIVRHQVDCAPCLEAECSRDFRCMKAIEPEEVWEAMDKLAERSRIR